MLYPSYSGIRVRCATDVSELENIYINICLAMEKKDFSVNFVIKSLPPPPVGGVMKFAIMGQFKRFQFFCAIG